MEGRIWVVVADEGRARCFSLAREHGVEDFREITAAVNPESRLYEKQLMSGQPGRTMNSATGSRHTYGTEERRRRHAAENFARSLASVLEKARHADRFDHFYLIADPAFLGLLRRHLTAQTVRLLRKDYARDMTRFSPQEIRALLPRYP